MIINLLNKPSHTPFKANSPKTGTAQLTPAKLRLKRDCPLIKNFPIIIAHRGFSEIAPENTMTAFQKAVDAGAQMIELDVTLSKDGEAFIIHDDTLDRTTNGKGEVNAHTSAQLRALDAGYPKKFGDKFQGEKIPTLNEVLNKFGRQVMINIEIKDPDKINFPKPAPGLEEKVINLVKSKGLEKNVIISSFNHSALRKVHRLAPELKIGVLTDNERIPEEALVITKELGGVSYNPCSKYVNKELVNTLQNNGVLITPWFFADDDKPKKVKNMVDLGVDGVFTNHTDELLEHVDKNNLAY